MNTAIDQHWSTYYTQGKDFTLISSQTISRFLKYTDPTAPKTCLDIGCGTGQLSRELWHRGYKVIGVDASTSAIAQARSLTVAPGGQLQYLHLDIELDDTAALSFQPYGLITCKLVYAFIHDKAAFISTVSRLLDAQGVFVVITPLVEHTPPEKQGIAVSREKIKLLQRSFKEVAWYEENGIGYFVGERL